MTKPTNRADILSRAIGHAIDIDPHGEGVATWRVFTMAGGIGPYLVEIIRDRGGEIMLRIVFTDDGSDIVISPDGGEIFDDYRSPADTLRPTGLRGDPG